MGGPLYLDREGGARRMTSGGTAHSRVGLVLSSVSGHLGNSAAGAEKGTAEILAAGAVLLRDGILPTDALTCTAETVKYTRSHRCQQVLETRNDAVETMICSWRLQGLCSSIQEMSWENRYHLAYVPVERPQSKEEAPDQL